MGAVEKVGVVAKHGAAKKYTTYLGLNLHKPPKKLDIVTYVQLSFNFPTSLETMMTFRSTFTAICDQCKGGVKHTSLAKRRCQFSGDQVSKAFKTSH